MRELKFRIWDEQNKCYVDYTTKINPNADTKNCTFSDKDIQGNFLCLVFNYADNPVIFSEKDIYGTDSYEVSHLDERFKIEQFTGLYDKHKKEIYEGDYVRILRSVYLVKFDQWTASFKLFNIKTKRYKNFYQNLFTKNLMEITSNKNEFLSNIAVDLEINLKRSKQ